MAVIRPFRALRPAADAARQVAAVPYDVVTADEARALAGGNPLSFLRVSRAEIDLLPDIDPYAPVVYEAARRNFEQLKQAAPLVHDEQPSLYFYRLGMGAHEQTGLAGCYSLDEYDRDIIKKHERTKRDKEDDRTRHMIALEAQTGPVLLTHRAIPDVTEIARTVCAEAPLYDLVAAGDVRHTVWRVSAEAAPAVVAAMGRLSALYIADGHHRAASAARARDEFKAVGRWSEEADWFLAVAFPDDQLQILPYNRVVKDLAGLTPARLLSDLQERCLVSPGVPSPRQKGHVSMYVDGRWYTVAWRDQPSPADPISALDASALQDRILGPVLNITDVRTDRRIDFIGGIRGTASLERLVDSGRAAVAFSLYPVTVGELMAVVDAGGIMPPKSTWFEPKLCDGLLSHELQPAGPLP